MLRGCTTTGRSSAERGGPGGAPRREAARRVPRHVNTAMLAVVLTTTVVLCPSDAPVIAAPHEPVPDGAVGLTRGRPVPQRRSAPQRRRPVSRVAHLCRQMDRGTTGVVRRRAAAVEPVERRGTASARADAPLAHPGRGRRLPRSGGRRHGPVSSDVRDRPRLSLARAVMSARRSAEPARAVAPIVLRQVPGTRFGRLSRIARRCLAHGSACLRSVTPDLAEDGRQVRVNGPRVEAAGDRRGSGPLGARAGTFASRPTGVSSYLYGW